MLKRLAIFGLLILFNGAWSQVPRDGGKQDKNAQEQQKPADPPKPVIAIKSPTGANNQDHASDEPPGYPWKELLAPANVPNWFLVIIAGVTGWFVFKTLRAIKKQADIMAYGQCLISPFSAAGEDVGSFDFTSLKERTGVLWCMGAIVFKDVFGEAWLIRFKHRWAYELFGSNELDSDGWGGEWIREGEKGENEECAAEISPN